MTVAPAALDALDLARWQFAATTVYHFILVPLTIGMSLFVAIMQTMWLKTGKEVWLKGTRFFGKLFLINFALGVATGIVQEFQFGMNWSEYSRYVGDIFGAPLAVEALLAFFMESTFLGLWIFGWGRLSPKAHTAMIWLAAIGVNLSALWIIGANSWMQHPVGAVFNEATGRAELDGVGGFLAVVLNPTLWMAIFHVITSAWLLSGTFIAGLAVWWMVRAARAGEETEAREIWRPLTRFGLVVLIVGGLGTAFSGHLQAQHMVDEQPAKMAAAEALCETPPEGEGAPFTIAAFGDCETGMTKIGEIPGLYSFLATNDFTAKIDGAKEVNQMYRDAFAKNDTFKAVYGDPAEVNFVPPTMITFWSFRIMFTLALFSAALALWGLWATRKGKISDSKGLARLGLISLPMPFIAANAGWIMTEVGRQPWVVVPNLPLTDLRAGNSDPVGQVYMLTQAGVSGAVPAGQVALTLFGFTLLYLALGVVWFLLLRRYAREGVHNPHHDEKLSAADNELSFNY